MNGDLESTLNELGPEYRDVVARLKTAREVEPSGTRDFSFPRTEWKRRVGYLVAASLARRRQLVQRLYHSPERRRAPRV